MLRNINAYSYIWDMETGDIKLKISASSLCPSNTGVHVTRILEESYKHLTNCL